MIQAGAQDERIATELYLFWPATQCRSGLGENRGNRGIVLTRVLLTLCESRRNPLSILDHCLDDRLILLKRCLLT
jgi:hypothetical protein